MSAGGWRSVRGMRGVVLALVVVAAASVPLAAQGPQARAVLPGIEGTILLDTMGIARPITGQRDSIFAALEKTFAELKIPVQMRDATTGMLRNLDAEISRRLGGAPLSRYLDCGRGFSGSNADIYRITLAVSAWLEPSSGTPERLVIAIAASGRDPSGSRSAYSQCTSRGGLEERIADRVRALVGG